MATGGRGMSPGGIRGKERDHSTGLRGDGANT